MSVLSNIEPKEVFKYFEAISAIPRGSKEEEKISAYLVDFAKERGLKYTQDEHLNVIIEKPASRGYENKKAFIIQSHMDMVNEKNNDVTHDFKKDGLNLYIDGDFLSAHGTTLGADNGIAVAMTLAILDGDYKHPYLKALFTANEESGMSGAIGVDTSHFDDCKYLLNIDSDEEGAFTTSCSGGLRHSINIPVSYEPTPHDSTTFKIRISGLEGGHSGMDIDKGLGNSNKLMARILDTLEKKDELYISYIEGGQKENAIPREAQACITVPEDFEDELNETIKNLLEMFKKEHRESEKNINIDVEKISNPNRVFSFRTTTDIIFAMMLSPNGVYRKAANGDLVTSSNQGVITTFNDTVIVDNLTRSNLNSEREYIVSQVKHIADIIEAEHQHKDSYNAWEYKEVSELRDICVDVYKRLHGESPILNATHGGLECGIFAASMPHLDMISFGPNNYYLHTPDERLSISSTERVFKYLVELIAAL